MTPGPEPGIPGQGPRPPAGQIAKHLAGTAVFPASSGAGAARVFMGHFETDLALTFSHTRETREEGVVSAHSCATRAPRLHPRCKGHTRTPAGCDSRAPPSLQCLLGPPGPALGPGRPDARFPGASAVCLVMLRFFENIYFVLCGKNVWCRGPARAGGREDGRPASDIPGPQEGPARPLPARPAPQR